jgi:hypothetical protein
MTDKEQSQESTDPLAEAVRRSGAAADTGRKANKDIRKEISEWTKPREPKRPWWRRMLGL